MGAFNTIDFGTPAGQALKAALEGRLEELRGQLESPEMHDAATQQTRGAIIELRRLLRPAPQAISTPRYSGLDFKRGQQ